MGMGLKSWNPGFERLGLGINSYTREWALSSEFPDLKDCDWGFKSYPREWEWDLSPGIPNLKDWDWELTPILGNGNGT